MKKILVVDDELLMLKLVQRVLKGHYETIPALSGEEGVRLFESMRPDMVLSDLRMPVMSGYELQEIIQAKSASPVPFIFMTADESDDNESRGLEMGAADYIRKPFSPDVLIKRIDRVFSHIEENSNLKRLAQTDAMTGLLNKFASEELIGERMREKSGILACLDLDSFKLVNDLYGHRMGDRVLVRFSELIRLSVREADIAGRIGGDEFVIFFENVHDPGIVRGKAEFLNQEILKSAKEYMGSGMEIPLGCSAGAAYADSVSDYGTVFQKADAALYLVKQAGKHGFRMYEEEAAEADPEIGGFHDIRLLYGERNPGRGALVADADSFKVIFRFIGRVLSNYPVQVHMVIFSFNGDPKGLRGAPDRFIELSRGILRSSDVLFKHGAEKVILILLKSEDERYKAPLDRIMKKWEEEGMEGVRVSFKMEGLLD